MFGKCVFIGCTGENPKDNGEGVCIPSDAPCKFGYVSSDPANPKFDCTSCVPGHIQILGKCKAFSHSCKGAIQQEREATCERVFCLDPAPKQNGEGVCIAADAPC